MIKYVDLADRRLAMVVGTLLVVAHRERASLQILRQRGVCSTAAIELYRQAAYPGLWWMLRRIPAQFRRSTPAMWGTGAGGAVVLGLLIIGVVKIVGRDGETVTASAAPMPVEPIVLPDSPQVVGPPVISSPAPVDRVAELKATLADARTRCLSRLYATREYQTASIEAERLEAEVRSLRKHDPGRELVIVSQRWILAKGVVGTLIAEALAADEEVQRVERALRGLGLIRTSWKPGGKMDTLNAAESEIGALPSSQSRTTEPVTVHAD